MRMAEQEQTAEKLFGAALDLPPEGRAAPESVSDIATVMGAFYSCRNACTG
jgi:hypothetical protein